MSADADALFNQALEELERTFRNSKRRSGSSNQFFPHQKNEETAIMNSQSNYFPSSSSNASYSDNYHSDIGNIASRRETLWAQIVDSEKTDEILRFKLDHLRREMIKNKKEIEEIKQSIDMHSSYSDLQSWQIQLLSEVSSMNLSYAHLERERLINQDKLRGLKMKYNALAEDSSESDRNSADTQKIVSAHYQRSYQDSPDSVRLPLALLKPSIKDNNENSKPFSSKRSQSEPDLGKMEECSPKTDGEAKNRCYTKDEVRLLKRELSCLMVNKMRTSLHRKSIDTQSEISESTATSPLCNLKDIVSHPKLSEFLKFSIPDIIQWMKIIGFESYAHKVNHHIRGPQHLLNLTSAELEKMLSMRNSLHRKRFLILLESVHRNEKPINHQFDVYATLNWLELIGLPQYKTNIMENMIDGTLLTYLTGYDLREIGVRNALHFLAIKWSLNRLYANNFSLDCFSKSLTSAHDDISSWSHSSTCEWISSLDLKDFMPNLFGYGCPGVLMISEPLFTAESLADILKIPSSKTLLRRHLTIHFNKMVGSSVVSDKREYLISRKNHIVTTDCQIKDIKKRLPFNLASKKYIFTDLNARLIV
ncbi:unnamed protein product [Auanema sp. JU1783]|nr:unnamed protein product [Auanema sp. JU1783]